MYPVSNAYLETIAGRTMETNWYGSIKTTIGTVYSFDPSIMVEGSGKITRQICTSEDIQIGTTCSSELAISLYLTNVDRYELYGATITLFFQLKVGGNWETVPVGVFTISEPPERSLDVVTIHAYDAMLNFNQTFGINLQGNPYYLLTYACNACGVTLGSTQEEIANYTNGTVETYTYPEVEVYTYRDFVGYIASYLCCFAYIGADGKLYLKPYGMNVTREVPASWRYEYKPKDYEAYYTALDAYFAISEEVESYTLMRTGLTYNLGTNPLIQFNADDLRKSVLLNILNKLSEAVYTPFTAKVPCDPSLMVGDVLNFTDNHAVDGKLSAITKQVITINGGMELECAGSDPNLNVLTDREKQIQTASHNSNKDGMYYYDFANSEDIEIKDGRSATIINFEYVTKKETHVDFHGEVRLLVETTETYDEDTDTYTEEDGVIYVTYHSGGAEVMEYYPINSFFDGFHLLHLVWTWWASANIMSTFEVEIRCEGCSVTIEQGASRGYLAGVGLVGDGAWDGSVHIYDSFTPVDFSIIRREFSETVQTGFQTPTSSQFLETVEKKNFSMILKNIGESVNGSLLHRFTVLWNENEVAYSGTHAQDGVWVNDNPLVDGTITTPAKAVTSIVKATSHHAESMGDVTFLASFDGGTTWYSYSGGWTEWTSGHGMAEPVMAAITQTEWATMLNGTIMIRAILEGDTQLRDIQIYTEVHQ